MVRTGHIFDALEYVRFGLELTEFIKTSPRGVSICAIETKRDFDLFPCQNQRRVMASEARCIDPGSADQRIVTEAAVEIVVAAATFERVAQLIADDGVGPRTPGNVFDADQRVGGDLDDKRRPEGVGKRLELGARTTGAIDAEAHHHLIGRIADIEEVVPGIIHPINAALAVERIVTETAREYVVQGIASQCIVEPGTDQTFDSTRATQRLRKTAPRPAGQLPLLPEVNRPVARLRDFGGGFMPPSVAREIEFLRRQLGLSQTQLASLIGRSQGQLANALRGHDPISGAAVNRLREVLLQKERCAKISILSIA
jgi:hypothetical protein